MTLGPPAYGGPLEWTGSATALTDGDRSLTWSELSWSVAEWAKRWHDAGCTAGDRVAVLAGNRAGFVEALLGAVASGLIAVPVNRHLTAIEVAHQLDDSGALVVAVDDALAGAVSERRVLSIDEADAEPLARSGVPSINLEGPAGATMMYTSGTTGRPKGVRRSGPEALGALLTAWSDGGRRVGLDGRGPHLATGPLYHAAPGLFAVYDLLNGAPLRIMSRWDPNAFLEHVAHDETTTTHLVPTMFVRLLELSDERREAADTSSLELVLHGAAPISRTVKHAMIDWLGPVLVEYWGASESGVVTLVDTAEWLEAPGTVGRALEGWEVLAVDGDGMPLPAGTPGTLVCRRPGASGRHFHYHGRPDATAAAYSATLTDPPAFSLGDLGMVDDQGRVHLTGRDAATIISGGVNIYPREIEDVLCDHPVVADAAVVGAPDDEWGEVVVAVVELSTDAAKEIAGILEPYLRERLAGFKVPRRFEVVDQLPRTPAGKVRIEDVRAPYWSQVNRSI